MTVALSNRCITSLASSDWEPSNNSVCHQLVVTLRLKFFAGKTARSPADTSTIDGPTKYNGVSDLVTPFVDDGKATTRRLVARTCMIRLNIESIMFKQQEYYVLIARGLDSKCEELEN